MSNNLYKLLDQAIELRKIAFYQSPHWDHDPTQEEKTAEDKLRRECYNNLKDLEETIYNIRDYLLNPFVEIGR